MVYVDKKVKNPIFLVFGLVLWDPYLSKTIQKIPIYHYGVCR